MLCSSVGRPKRPTCATYGGRKRGMPRLPSIDSILADAGAPGSDQHPFEEAMRITLEVPAVLEGARLTFVDVHRHQARLGFSGDDAPLASGGESGAAQAAQRRVLQDLRDLVARALARQTIRDQLVAATLAVGREVDVARLRAAELLAVDRTRHRRD